MAKEKTARVAVITLLSLLTVLVFESKAAMLSSPYDINQWPDPFFSDFVATMSLIISPEPSLYSTGITPESTMLASEPVGDTRVIPGASYLPDPWILNPMFGARYFPPWAMNPFGYSPDMAFLSSTEWEIAVKNDSNRCILGPVGRKYKNFWEAVTYGIPGNIVPGRKFNFYGKIYELVYLCNGFCIPVLSRCDDTVEENN